MVCQQRGEKHSAAAGEDRDVPLAVQKTEGETMSEGPKRTDGQGADIATAQKWHPVNLDLATTKNQYITGMHALNLEDHQSGETGGTADWHEPAALWTLRPTEPGDHANVNVVVPYRTLGDDGVEDGRYALRGPGHPGADSDLPIWKATHARAVVDLAFDRWHHGNRNLRGGARFGPIAPWTVADWLWTERQIETVRGYAERAEIEVSPADRAWWRAWWKSLRFASSHEDYINA